MIKAISASLNLTSKPGKIVAAVGDVTVDLGEAGSLKLCGFRVMLPDGKPAWVSGPARHGHRAWFDTVVLKGPVRKMVEAAVLDEFDRLRKSAEKS
jgi:hypothetical protein